MPCSQARSSTRASCGGRLSGSQTSAVAAAPWQRSGSRTSLCFQAEAHSGIRGVFKDLAACSLLLMHPVDACPRCMMMQIMGEMVRGQHLTAAVGCREWLHMSMPGTMKCWRPSRKLRLCTRLHAHRHASSSWSHAALVPACDAEEIRLHNLQVDGGEHLIE